MIQDQKTRYKAVGIAAFCLAAGLASLRILSYFVWEVLSESSLSELAAETISDTIFTVLSQVVVCFLVPFLIYIFIQKRTPQQIFKDANYKRLKWWIPLLCVPMGIGCLFVTFFTSNAWLTVLINFGYNYNPPATLYSERFNPLMLLLQVFLTGVLPAICEEFAMRGNLLNALKGTNRHKEAIIFAAIAFGLFHQNITQIFYTAIFGGFAAFIVIKTGSVLPAIVLHFVNNTLSVIWSFGTEYGWSLFTALDKIWMADGGLFLFLFMGLILVVGGTALILNQCKKDGSEERVTVIYRPSLRENAWLIGAVAIAVFSTIFTFAFGLY